MLGRNKRGTGEIEFESLDFGNRGGGGGDNIRGKGEEMGMLESVIRDTRKALRNTKNFWQKLPYHMCGNEVAANQEEPCWNGKSRDK